MPSTGFTRINMEPDKMGSYSDSFLTIEDPQSEDEGGRTTLQDGSSLRNRGFLRSTDVLLESGYNGEFSDIAHQPRSRSDIDLTAMDRTQRRENEIEAHKIQNNYLFGFKKWKGHVTERPLSSRSEIVQNLYADINKVKPMYVSTIRPFNIIYVILFGWWLALLYVIVGCLMCLTIIGYKYGFYSFMMAKYFIWPFGKFVHLVHKKIRYTKTNGSNNSGSYGSTGSTISTDSSNESLTGKDNASEAGSSNAEYCIKVRYTCLEFLKRPQSYIWLIIGVPILLIVHTVIMALSWLMVISIPIAKLNLKAITQILFLPPDKVKVADYSTMGLSTEKHNSEIIMYTHRSVYVYYYKYTVDGMNIILVNMLVFVILVIVLGLADPDNKICSGVVKCLLGVFAIVPLTYYIGLAIISISAQSNFAVGAFINATFGSVVEIIIFVVTLMKGKASGSTCYAELVKASLTGAIVGSMLFIPGICMVVGGIKHHSQRFNPKATNITALLMFVAVGGVFAPTLFSKIYGDMQCSKCENVMAASNGSLYPDNNNVSYALHCANCKVSVLGLDGDRSLYEKHVQPLVYACCLMLPIAYIIGMVFALKTHSAHIYGEKSGDTASLKDTEVKHKQPESTPSHGSPNWSRLKSAIILLGCAGLIALCADIITNNIEPFMNASGISTYFVGMTMIAMIPELPEIVNGIQFALLNNVSLGIEIGTSTSIQVCMIQIPVLVLINLIYPFDFIALFNEVHLWSVIFSVIVINYTFQDGKSDYFQGFALVAIYLILLCMYFFIPVPHAAIC